MERGRRAEARSARRGQHADPVDRDETGSHRGLDSQQGERPWRGAGTGPTDRRTTVESPKPSTLRNVGRAGSGYPRPGISAQPPPSIAGTPAYERRTKSFGRRGVSASWRMAIERTRVVVPPSILHERSPRDDRSPSPAAISPRSSSPRGSAKRQTWRAMTAATEWRRHHERCLLHSVD
jgi:hypothetical protein